VARRVERGAIHLVRFPPPDKPRPVVVLTRSSALRFLSRVTVAPITSTIRDIPTEVVLGIDDGMKTPCAVNLDNVVTLSRDRLGKLVGQLPSDRLEEICRALAFAVGCDSRADP
jgi:mRNA interferase MazF